jgi:RNA polymerase sigma-70 factor (ECF subfamily)
VVLTEIDRDLLERCVQDKPRAWEDFVDRFMGLVVHVVNHTAQIRGLRFSPEDRDDLVSEVFLGILKDNFAVLRHFRGQSSLATYLTVVARRIVVRMIVRQKSQPPHSGNGSHRRVDEVSDLGADPGDRIGDRDEVERLLDDLDESEAKVVRMHHLEGKSYREISSEMGVPENSIGPILSRARDKMRRARVNPAAR